MKTDESAHFAGQFYTITFPYWNFHSNIFCVPTKGTAMAIPAVPYPMPVLLANYANLTLKQTMQGTALQTRSCHLTTDLDIQYH